MSNSHYPMKKVWDQKSFKVGALERSQEFGSQEHEISGDHGGERSSVMKMVTGSVKAKKLARV